MKTQSMVTLLLTVFLVSALALAQSEDWQAVKDLPQGTKIKILLKHGRTFGHCRFEGAVDDELACSFPSGSRVYARKDIRAVCLVHNGASIGLAIGAGLGAGVGAARDPAPGLGRGGTALVDAGLLGGLGMAFGAVLNPFFHGKTIYRTPTDRTAEDRHFTAPGSIRHPSTELSAPKSVVVSQANGPARPAEAP